MIYGRSRAPYDESPSLWDFMKYLRKHCEEDRDEYECEDYSQTTCTPAYCRCVTDLKLGVKMLVKFDVEILDCCIIDSSCTPVPCNQSDSSRQESHRENDWLETDSIEFHGDEAQCKKQVQCCLTQHINVTLELTYKLKVKSCKIISIKNPCIECELPIDCFTNWCR